jgi:hypothetical protein
MDPFGAVESDPKDSEVREAQRALLSGKWEFGETVPSECAEIVETLIATLPEQAAAGALNPLFLGTKPLAQVAHQLNGGALKNASTAPCALEAHGGGAGPLLEKLLEYVREHPFEHGTKNEVGPGDSPVTNAP